jgi:integrase
LKRLYGPTPAGEFGPVALCAVREEMIRLGWCRTHINRQANRLRHVFKWAAGRELLPPSVYHALQAVDGLKAGRSEARESAAVAAVTEEHARAVLPFLSDQVRAMVELQLLTGMRPGEVIRMRTCDIDTTGALWTYTPLTHKTSHQGQDRQIMLGPRAKDILGPMLKTDLQAFIFSPADAVTALREKRRAARKTPLSCGNKPGSNVRRSPRRQPGQRYTVESYGHAIKTACDRAFPPPAALARQKLETRTECLSRLSAEEQAALRAWQKSHRFHPHQLRHTAATRLRRQHGLEAAQVILGHKML